MIFKISNRQDFVNLLSSICDQNKIATPNWKEDQSTGSHLIDLDNEFVEKLKVINPDILDQIKGV